MTTHIEKLLADRILDPLTPNREFLRLATIYMDLLDPKRRLAAVAAAEKALAPKVHVPKPPRGRQSKLYDSQGRALYRRLPRSNKELLRMDKRAGSGPQRPVIGLLLRPRKSKRTLEISPENLRDPA